MMMIYDSDDISKTDSLKRTIMTLKQDFKMRLCTIDSKLYTIRCYNNDILLIPIIQKIE